MDGHFQSGRIKRDAWRSFAAYRPRERRHVRTRPPVYRNRQSLLTRGEIAFFRSLTAAVADRFLIMCKVRLADIVTCSDAAWRRGAGSAIAQKHLDFVLCDVATLRFVLAIELDDCSHDRPQRRRRDRFVDGVLRGAGVDLIRIRARSRYTPAAIRHALGIASRDAQNVADST